MSETTEQPVSTSTAARARRGDGLSGMVLADLKALAGQLGIKGTSGLRKGDLVSAIASHQNSSAAASSPRNATTNGGATDVVTNSARTKTVPERLAVPDGTAPTGRDSATNGVESPRSNGHAGEPTLSLDLDLPQRPPRRRSAGRPEGAPVVTEQSDSAPDSSVAARSESAPPAPRSDSAPAGQVNGQSTAASEQPDEGDRQSSGRGDQGATGSTDGQQGERQERAAYDGDDGPRNSRRNRRNRRDNRGADGGTEGQATGNEGGSRDGQNAQGGQNRDGQNRDGQGNRNNNRDNRQDGNRQDGNRQDNRAQDNRAQDGEDGDGRRGRRFRDRNRRSRDRFADAPTDTEVRDDDVLVPVAGIVDVLDSYAFIRTSGYLSGPNDVYVSLSQIRKNGLRRGDAVTGAVRAPRDGESANTRQKFNALVRLDSVNGQDPELAKDRPEFTKLTPLYPNERLRLETESHILTTRIIDLVMPVGKGQRALIVSPPKAGKTSILQAVANAITTNNPEVHLMVVLVDERPEEVTDMQRSVKGEVIASTFDRPPADHTMVAELSIERAKRLVEMGRDVVVLLDSITRLGRAYNLAAPASGRILSGGVDSTALFPPKRFLGAARNIENGGSLTIFASALVETGSAGDTVIFEEFKGTGNAELKLDRRIADKRIFPAIDVDQSSTRKEDLLLSPDELAITVKLRRVLSALDSQQALELLLDRLRKTKSNVEFLMQVAKTTNGVGND